MSDDGRRQRWRDGQAQAANATNLERRLEGPGAEQRLDRIRSRFRKALAGGGWASGSIGVTTLSVLVFLAVVAIGLWLTR